MGNQPTTEVVQDVIAVSQGNAVGCIAYWQLSGRAPEEELSVALSDLADIDLKHAPKAPPVTEILRRSCRAVIARGGWMLDKHPVSGHVFIAREEQGSNDPLYTADLHVWAGPGDHIHFSNDTHPLAERIRDEVLDRSGRVDTTEISAWLSEFTKRDCRGASLRPSGGFYYIPSAYADHFRAAVGALRTCSQHTVYEIPAMASTETAAAIIAALRAECEVVLEEVREFADADTKRQPRSYKRKLDELATLDEKLTTYAEFMDGQLDDVVGSLENVRIQISQSLLETSDEEASDAP